jgi:ribonuclease VapC
LVIDTSALVAILQAEPVAERLILALYDAPARRMSTATLVEAGIVMQRRFGDAGESKVDALIAELQLEVLPLTADHSQIARDAFRRFGKGRHQAGLNFGDCFSYALARSLGEPLLFVGEDFGFTDVEAALY